MQNQLIIYNSLTRKKELFKPINPPHVGLYVCGPTVYSEPHLGHVRMAVNYDVLFRYLNHTGYKVRYVRNITDVGHLEDELTGEGEDRILKKARIEQLEPMEIVQKYKNTFQHTLELLNVLAPSIEPQASGHIIEQQMMIKKIIENGYAYEVNGSVYFDIEKYDSKYHYGKLSGRKIGDLLTNTRELEGQDEKHFPLDFALWKKAGPNHLMKWPSHWSEGFPGWHLECSAMGTKYLGETFDIHGGGMDLLFPHHECEIAQAVAANGKEHVRYWVHNNMITIDGQKMARSLNNFITLKELFSGTHPKLVKAYAPGTIRFFVLQAHYRSIIDFSNEALLAAETGLKKILSAVKILPGLKVNGTGDGYVENLKIKCYDAMNDDLNTPVLLAHIFDAVRIVNSVDEGHKKISREELDILKEIFDVFVKDILGLEEEIKSGEKLTEGLISLLLNIRNEARMNRDFAASDRIREELHKLGIQINDTKDGSEWEME